MVRLKFFSVILALISLVALKPSWGNSSSIPPRFYSYPYLNPFQATFTSLLVQPSQYEYEESEFTFYPERSKLPLVGSRNRLRYTYKLQVDPSAPLIFVFPGLGGHAFSGLTLYLAEQAYQLGYSVVTLPSSSHWSFALAASRTGRVGYSPADAQDSLKVLNFIRSKLESENRLRPRGFAIMGYSYGALDSAFVAAEDLQQKKFQFDRILLINPPLDRKSAIEKLDSYYAKGLEWSEQKRESALSKAFGSVIYATPHLAYDVFAGKNKDWISLEDSTLAWLIADQFRDSLRDMIFVSQEIHDDGFLREMANPFHQNARLKEAKNFTFESYLDKVVFSYWANQLKRPIQDLYRDSQLIEATRKVQLQGSSNQKVVLFHNEDDFLSSPEGTQELQKYSGELRVYPYGGHIGNLWFEQNLEDLRSTLRW